MQRSVMLERSDTRGRGPCVLVVSGHPDMTPLKLSAFPIFHIHDGMGLKQ